MKTLRNFVVTGGLLRSNGDQAQVGDTVRLYPYEGDSFLATIEAVAPVNCGQDRAYAIEYDLDVVLRVCNLQDMGDVLDCCGLLNERVEAIEETLTFDQPIFLTSRFSTDNFDRNINAQALAVLASSSYKTAGYATKLPAYVPPVPGLRDPSITFWKGKYFVAYTAGDFGQVDYFPIISSENLVDWEFVTNVVVDQGAKTWAPEFFADYERDELYIVVGSNTSWPADSSLYLLKALNSSLTNWTAPVKLSGFANPVNDGCIRRIGNIYHLACTYLDEGNFVEFWTAENIEGPYIRRLANDHSGWGAFVEGACLVNIEGEKWMVTVDQLNSAGNTFYAISEDGMDTWGPMVYMPAPKGLRHGSTIKVDPKEHFKTLIGSLPSFNGNLVNRSIGSVNFYGGVSASLAYAEPQFWAAVGFANNVGWFFCNNNGARAGSGSYGIDSQDRFRSGFLPDEPCSVLVGLANNSVRGYLGGVLKTISTTAASASGSVETDLHRYVIPEKALHTNGDTIVWTSYGKYSAGTANTKTASFKVAGLEILNTSSTYDNVRFKSTITLIRKGANSVLVFIEILLDNSSSTNSVILNLDTTQTIELLSTGTGDVASDVEVFMSNVDWIPSTEFA